MINRITPSPLINRCVGGFRRVFLFERLARAVHVGIPTEIGSELLLPGGNWGGGPRKENETKLAVF